MIFKKKRSNETKTYDALRLKPVIRCSICTGEQAAGFQDIHTGKFTEVMLIRTKRDMDEFKRMYGLSDVDKVY